MKEVRTPPVALLGSAQDAPISLPMSGGAAQHTLKIDVAVRQHGLIIVTGWCTDADAGFALGVAGENLPGHLTRFDRMDVRHALGIDDNDCTGFGLICEYGANHVPDLRITTANTSLDLGLRLADTPDPSDLHHYLPVVFSYVQTLPIGARLWRRGLAVMPEAGHDPMLLQGHIDAATATTCGGYLAGWEIHNEQCLVWLEDDKGRAYDLDRAYRYFRDDVHAQSFPVAETCLKPGFLCDVPLARPGMHFRICGCSSEGRFAMPQTIAKPVSCNSPIAARALFEVNTPRLDLPNRMRKVDLPFLGRINKKEAERQHAAPHKCYEIGSVADTPDISVIVPLYGRSDMVEHQLLEFNKDADFQTCAETIFVIDDPRMNNSFAAHARIWHDICGVPFRWVSAGDNRGFSGACNLGASVAKGKTLVFMNSDVIPINSGWASALAKVLQDDPNIALVAPRLLFPDGSIQHAGMAPKWRDALGLWTNHHPMMGMAPELDPAKGVTKMPLVTGACIAISRDDFDKLGGWSTDFLIGDFEDSDMCLSLRAAGRDVAYVPEVELVHLERQSLASAGETEFRDKMTILNATLYNTRWRKMLDGLAN